MLEHHTNPTAAVAVTAEPSEGQLSLGMAMEQPILQKLRSLDVNTLTPIEAMQTLYALCEEARHC